MQPVIRMLAEWLVQQPSNYQYSP